ncbi:nuclease-related domain-containing protein [Nocardioides kribbensis]|uniref:nuclease-related domain-containing protein n=1 Tax=Nocardioides kribbensis TaxID=305517 RepID=UPI0032DAEF62
MTDPSAGESAEAVARRHREKIARLERAAERWERGAAGERATADVLATLPAEWTAFHDIRWPGRKLANVDHVVLGPGGVFVIDTKNWSGVVEVRDDVLRQGGWKREREVAAAAEAAIAVSLATPHVSSQLAVPVLCFVREERVEGWARDVMVCSTSTLTEMLLSRPTVLEREQLRQIWDALRAMPRATGPASHAPMSTESVSRGPVSLGAGGSAVRRKQPPARTPGPGRTTAPPRPGPSGPRRSLAALAATLVVGALGGVYLSSAGDADEPSAPDRSRTGTTGGRSGGGPDGAGAGAARGGADAVQPTQRPRPSG